ncbi:MAG: carotenoid oxygenase family protein [Acidimicrobiia bacterium]
MPVPASLTTAPQRDFELEVVSGVWPTDLSGDVLFSSPQLRAELPYGVFGWGSICRLSLDPGARGASAGRFAWQSRSVETPGKRLYNRHPEVFTTGPVGYNSPFGPANAANTAPLPWGNRLYATWDGGRPVELNPDTLEFVAEVGNVDSWGGSSLPFETLVPFLLSSAHPVADPDRGCLWTVKLTPDLGATFAMLPSLVRYDRHDGTQVSHWPLDGVAFPGSIHTVSQTRDWIILSDSGNFKADPNEMMGGERTVTIDAEVPVWLIRKDQVEGLPSGTPVTPICLTMTPPSGHFYARWDDSDGISVVWEGMDLMDLGLCLRADDLDVHGNPISPAAAGLYNMAMAPETITEVIFHPDTAKIDHVGTFKRDWTFNLQLSAMDWSTEGISAPTLHHVDFQGCRPGNVSRRAATMYADRIDLDQLREETPGALCSFDRPSMELKARWEYPNLGDHITSPTFVPRGSVAGSYVGGEPGGHDGYVVQPVCNDDGFRVELFDAANVSAGPVATIAGTARETIPLVLHSAWMPAFSGLADAERLRFSDEVNATSLASVPEELHPAVFAVAEECDNLW